MDYAGVARILKLDAALSEAVVAVKLQEVGERIQFIQLGPCVSLLVPFYSIDSEDTCRICILANSNFRTDT